MLLSGGAAEKAALIVALMSGVAIGVKGAVVAHNTCQNCRAAAGEWESSVEQDAKARDKTVSIRIIAVRLEAVI